jgi:phage tail-like protein
MTEQEDAQMMDRRSFLKSTGIAFASIAAGAAEAQLTQQTRFQRPGTVGAVRYILELDGAAVGILNSFEGGTAVGTVVVTRSGTDLIERKHLGAVRYEEITLQHGAEMSAAYYDWIKSTLNRNYMRKNGAIVTLDFNGREISRMSFFNALITEVGFPALDASTKESAKMTIKIAPELTRTAPGSGATGKIPSAKLQKPWLSSHFRLKIDGLETACTRVSKIDSLAIKQKTLQSSAGDGRDYLKEPGKIEYPNLVVTLAEPFSQDFYKFHESFVIKGNAGDAQEKAGTLEFLAPNLQDVYFTLTFKNLGIFKLSPESAGAEKLRTLKAEMYCELIAFDPKSAAA